LRIPALGSRGRRIAQLALIPTTALALGACATQPNTNPTGDTAAPNLFGETSNGIGFPHEVVTTEGIASAGLYFWIFAIAVVIFILVEGLLLYSALRFRKRSTGADLPEQVHGSNRLEIIWTAIPMAVVFVLFVGSTIVLTDVEAKSDDPTVVVDVTAQSFGWTFEYQAWDEAEEDYVDSGVAVFGRTAPPSTEDPAPPGLEAVLPVGEPVRIRLTAREGDVIHSWYVPAFFFKRDAIPGRVNEFEFTIEQPGTYGGQCAEFCGLLHSQMFFTIRAVEADQYQAWIDSGGTMTFAPGAGDDGDGEPEEEGTTPAEETA
jgi:cytochrome c oxidase subunit 2